MKKVIAKLKVNEDERKYTMKQLMAVNATFQVIQGLRGKVIFLIESNYSAN